MQDIRHCLVFDYMNTFVFFSYLTVCCLFYFWSCPASVLYESNLVIDCERLPVVFWLPVIKPVRFIRRKVASAPTPPHVTARLPSREDSVTVLC